MFSTLRVSLFKKITVFSFSALAACGGSLPKVANESRVTTVNGDVVGYASDFNTFAWKGIPYAAAPVGDLRWRAPRPVKSWSEPLEALSFGPACIQPPNPTSGDNAPEQGNVVGSEDCLYLNVFAPQDAVSGNKALPVMFWIHGGANIVGSAAAYDGAKLANTQGVVVVTLHYRLGLLGWLRHASLRSDDASLEDNSGNYGTLDIIAGLQWVQNNIQVFGGDPNQVTVFGESAGGRNTWSMIQSPLAKGLFHRAIVQSGSLRIMDPIKSESYDTTAIDYPVHVNNGDEIVTALLPEWRDKLSGVALELRKLSPSDVYDAAVPRPEGIYDQPRLFLDGHVFVEPALSLFKDPSKYNSVPIMTGTNRDEDKLFLMFDDRWTDFRWGFLPELKDVNRYNKAVAFGADYWRLLSVDVPTEVITKNGGAPVYNYRFDFDELVTWPVDMANLLGAAHALEIPFVFGSYDESIWGYLIDDEPTAAVVSEAMMNYWGEFARTGNPGQGGVSQPLWKPWGDSGEHIMLFDSAQGGGVRMVEDRLTLDSYQQRLFNEKEFTTQELCEAYRLIVLNGYQTPEFYSAETYAAIADESCPM